MWRKIVIQRNMSALMEKLFSKMIGKFLLFNGSPDPLFMIFLVVCCISLIKVVSNKNTFPSTSPVGKWVLSIIGIVCNLMFSQQGHFVVECMEDTNNNNSGKGKEPLEHEGVPPELKSREDLMEVPFSPAEKGAPSAPPTHEKPLLMGGAGHAKTLSGESFHSALEDPTHVEENQPPSSKRAKAMLLLKKSWTKVKVFPGKFTGCFFAGMGNELGRHAANCVFPDDDTDFGGD
jgi:hypothetical protein